MMELTSTSMVQTVLAAVYKQSLEVVRGISQCLWL